jgi:hypothetical protein
MATDRDDDGVERMGILQGPACSPSRGRATSRARWEL